MPLGVSNSSTKIADMVYARWRGSDVFVHVHEVEAAGMKTLVAGQLLTYNTAPARWPHKAVNLRLLVRQVLTPAASSYNHIRVVPPEAGPLGRKAAQPQDHSAPGGIAPGWVRCSRRGPFGFSRFLATHLGLV
jgi:cold shock CspA family protein